MLCATAPRAPTTSAARGDVPHGVGVGAVAWGCVEAAEQLAKAAGMAGVVGMAVKDEAARVVGMDEAAEAAEAAGAAGVAAPARGVVG